MQMLWGGVQEGLRFFDRIGAARNQQTGDMIGDPRKASILAA